MSEAHNMQAGMPALPGVFLEQDEVQAGMPALPGVFLEQDEMQAGMPALPGVFLEQDEMQAGMLRSQVCSWSRMRCRQGCCAPRCVPGAG